MMVNARVANNNNNGRGARVMVKKAMVNPTRHSLYHFLFAGYCRTGVDLLKSDITGDFGTFVVHGGTEGKTSSSHGSPKASVLSVKTDISSDLRGDTANTNITTNILGKEFRAESGFNQEPIASTMANKTFQTKVGGIANLGNQSMKSGTVSHKAFSGQDKPMALPPSVYQRLTSSPTLVNLAQALAYHKTCYEEMPLQELQVAQEQQTTQNLCDTLRTILRL